jgi:hypothetical protein
MFRIENPLVYFGSESIRVVFFHLCSTIEKPLDDKQMNYQSISYILCHKDTLVVWSNIHTKYYFLLYIRLL